MMKMVRFEDLSIEQIDVGEGIRKTIEKEPLEELAASIALHGVLQPLVVEPGEEGLTGEGCPPCGQGLLG
jgi:ParB-like chromosome segregation protein Spo0J